jgi:hypothetical protein
MAKSKRPAREKTAKSKAAPAARGGQGKGGPPFRLLFTEEAARAYASLKSDPQQAVRFRKVGRTFGYLQTNPRHPSLNTHKYTSKAGPNGEEVFEAYVENNTPGAFRVFFWYGPERGEITVLAITEHP